MIQLVVILVLTSLSLCLPNPGTLEQVKDFGPNPTKAGFYIYIPKKLSGSPAIVVAVHYCTGSGPAYFGNSPYKTLAEQHGFIAIYPSSPHEGGCWDVSSKATLTHNGGGDSNAIVTMVEWVMKNYPVDRKKVFVTGTSSGAMMTNVLAATYPDIFAAGVAYSGVPAGCFTSTSNSINAWNSTCAQGRINSTPQTWAAIARNMYPGYNGPRPKMQIYHGGNDKTLFPQNYNETIKQWCGIFGYEYSKPVSSRRDVSSGGYVWSQWGSNLEGLYSPGVGHSVPIFGARDMEWFGIK